MRCSRTPVRSLPPPAVVPAAEARVTYTLVHTGEDPDVFPELARRHAGLGLCGPGWSVLAAHGSRWSWSIGLDVHGAAFGAPPADAQAVAVRVLADHAIRIEGWDPPDPDARAYVAVTWAAVADAEREVS
jgi:hypothetical protein